MIKLKETSRLGRRLKERTGLLTVGDPSATPQSSHDIGDSGGPRYYAAFLVRTLRLYDPAVISFCGEDPRNRDWNPPPRKDEANDT